MKTVSLLMFLSAVLLCGCFGGKASQQKALAQKRTFVPLAETAQAVTPSPDFAAVKIRPFRVLPPFDARTFIVYRAEGEFAADFYNGWLAQPQDLIRVQTTRYLEQAKLFKAVYDIGCGTMTPLGLEGVVSELYLDYSGEKPAAVVTMRLLVLDERVPSFNVLFSEEKSTRVTFAPNGKTAASHAFGQALTQTLEALVKALAKAPLPSK